MATAEARSWEASRREEHTDLESGLPIRWPVAWSGVVVGALSAAAVASLLGLVAVAIGAHLLGPEHRIVDLKKLGVGAMVFGVCGSFFAFVVGGWVAAKIAGLRRSEPAMLHGAIAWLVGVPFLVAMAALGTSGLSAGWFAGMTGVAAANAASPYQQPAPLGLGATEKERTQYEQAQVEYDKNVTQWREETPRAVRNSALFSITALLLGLVGSVIGGWMACGEPMNFTHYRTRRPEVARR